MSGPVSRETLLKPDEIEVVNRLRPVSPAGVASLIASITEIGVIKDPIHVRKLKGGRYRLIAGAHRLAAVKELNWNMVTARVWDGTGCTDDWCRMMEVDDNLAGAEMNVLDSAVFLAERRRLFLKMHPEKAQHRAGATARWDARDIVSFASSTAAKFGISDRHVKRLVMAGEAILGPDADRLRAAGAPIRLNDLLAVAKADAAMRPAAIEGFCDGTFKRLRDGLKPTREAPVKDPVEEAFTALRTAWEKAPEAARRKFVGAHHAALSARVREEAERLIIAQKLGVANDDPAVDRVKAAFGPGKVAK